MNLFIHIEVNEINLLHFQKEILKWASGNLNELNIIDFDNHSDGYMVDSVIKLMKDAHKLALIIDIQSSGAGTGRIVNFLNALIRLKKESVLVIMNGSHDIIGKMIRTFRHHQINLNIDAQKENLASFFKG